MTLYDKSAYADDWWVRGDYSSAQTNASLKAAGTLGQTYFITDIHLSNEGAANTVTLLDGSGGTVLWKSYLAVNQCEDIQLRTPIKLTAETALCITTTAADHIAVAIGGFTGR